VHELVRTLGLLDHSGVDPKRAKVIPPAAIGKKELARFHGEDFIGRSVGRLPPTPGCPFLCAC
jgi:hypothetical protein